MPTRFFLIRHGMCDPVGRVLAGRTPGVHLNEDGRSQARALADRLATTGLDAIYSSPLDRTRETAAILARPRGLEVRTLEALVEVDFGEWTGKSFEELGLSEDWRNYNLFRSVFRIPGGESITEVQSRVIGALWALSRRHLNQSIALVSHGDVIKAAVTHLAGMPSDFFMRLEIDPASITSVRVDAWGPTIESVNVPPLLTRYSDSGE